MEYKQNVVKVSLGSYRHNVRGVPKIGKTTFFRDLVKEEFGRYDGGLLISLGNETGFKAIPHIFVKEASDTDDGYAWDIFVEIVDDLVENKENNNFELIGIDTTDELVRVAEQKVLRIHRSIKKKPANSINEALGGYGSGQKKVVLLISDELARLENAGYGIIFIGHTKIKPIKEKDGEEYSILTGNLDGRYDKLFTDKADINSVMTTEKSGDAVERYIYFRYNGYVDAGSRFPDMPMRVKMSAKNYIKAFNHGVKASLEVDGDKDISKMKAEEDNKRKSAGKEYSESEKKEKEDKSSLELKKDEIQKIVSGLSSEDKREIRVKLEKIGIDVKGFKSSDSEKELDKIIKTLGE